MIRPYGSFIANHTRAASRASPKYGCRIRQHTSFSCAKQHLTIPGKRVNEAFAGKKTHSPKQVSGFMVLC